MERVDRLLHLLRPLHIGGRQRDLQLREALEQVSLWSAESTETAMRNYAEANNLKLGAVAQPLRAALTGRTTSPGIFEVLAVLGREECLGRLADQAAAQ